MRLLNTLSHARMDINGGWPNKSWKNSDTILELSWAVKQQN
jgi:hypothetical protein